MRLSRQLRDTGLLLVVLAIPAFSALRVAAIAPTFHIDGAFQTASGLFRLYAGQLPGRDFLPYLGIGPLLVLYPPFALLGANLASSVFAAHLLTVVCLQVAVCITAWLIVSPSRRVLLILAGVIGGMAVAATWMGVPEVDTIATPGNSLRPIRAFAPYVFALAMWVLMAPSGHPKRRALLVGVVIGAIFIVWSNDYATTSAGLCLLALGWYLAGRQGAVPNMLLVSSAALASALAVGALITGGHLIDYLRYNWVDVRGDQVWYFGPWDAVRRVVTPLELANAVVSQGGLLPTIVLALVAVTALLRRDQPRILVLAYIGAALLLGGVTATVGGHIDKYFVPFRMWGLTVICFGGAKLAFATLAQRTTPRLLTPLMSSRCRVITASAGMTLLVCSGIGTGWGAYQAWSSAARDLTLTYEPRLGSFLDRRFEAHVSYGLKSSGRSFEEYAGLWMAALGTPGPAQVDSVISALGSQRARFQRVAERADLVVTSAPEMSDWVGWSVSANWWFYRRLFEGYRPERTSPTTLTWKRVSQGLPWQTVNCTVNDEARTVTISSDHVGLYEVQLRYRGPGSQSRHFSMITNNIDWPLDAVGRLALDPGASSQALPVLAPVPEPTALRLYDRGDPESRVTLLGCDAKSIPEGSGTAAGLYLPEFIRQYDQHRSDPRVP